MAGFSLCGSERHVDLFNMTDGGWMKSGGDRHLIGHSGRMSEVAILAIGGMNLDEYCLLSSEHYVHEPRPMDPYQNVGVSQ